MPAHKVIKDSLRSFYSNASVWGLIDGNRMNWRVEVDRVEKRLCGIPFRENLQSGRPTLPYVLS